MTAAERLKERLANLERAHFREMFDVLAALSSAEEQLERAQAELADLKAATAETESLGGPDE